MKFTNILIEKSNAFAKVTINRPKKLNALNSLTIHELRDAFEALENDDMLK